MGFDEIMLSNYTNSGLPTIFLYNMVLKTGRMHLILISRKLETISGDVLSSFAENLGQNIFFRTDIQYMEPAFN